MHVIFGLLQAILITGAICSNPGDPGLKARVTQAGLNYVTPTVIDVISQEIEGMKLQNQAGTFMYLNYETSNTYIATVTNNRINVSIIPSGLALSFREIEITIGGDWYLYQGWYFYFGSGKFDARFSNVSIDVAISIGIDDKGRPRISSENCFGDIGGVSVSLKESWMSGLYNQFTGYIERAIKDYFNQEMCKMIQQLVDNGLADTINTLPITSGIYKDLRLDYRFVSDPQFTSNYIETYHKGNFVTFTSVYGIFNESFSSDGASHTTPLTTLSNDVLLINDKSSVLLTPLPTITEEDKMYYLSASDNILNRFAYQAQKHGYLSYNVTSQNLPDSISGILNTSCTTGICVGMLLNQLGEKYPNRQVELRMYTAQTPEVHIKNGSIDVFGYGMADVYVITEDSEDLIFSLNITLDIGVALSIRNGTLYGKIKNLNIGISTLNSTIGGIDVQYMQHAVDGVVKLFIEPQLNAVGRLGYELPILMNFRAINTKLVLMENTLIFGTDVEYVPDDEI